MAQINFVLARRVFVEAVLHGNAHGFECANGFFAQRTCDIGRGEIEKATLVKRDWFVGAIGWRKIKIFDVGRDVERVTLFARCVEIAFQDLARVAIECCSVKFGNVTKNSGLGTFRVCPRENFKCVGVGEGEHVALLHAAVAVDRGTVKRHSVVQRIFHFGWRNGERFECAEHIGKPESHQSDTAFLYGAKDVVALLVLHRCHTPVCLQK